MQMQSALHITAGVVCCTSEPFTSAPSVKRHLLNSHEAPSCGLLYDENVTTTFATLRVSPGGSASCLCDHGTALQAPQ